MKIHHSESATALEPVADGSSGPAAAHYGHQGQTGLFLGRAPLVSRVARELSAESGSAGCLLIGAPGSGKSALMRHILSVYCRDCYVVQVRGSAFAGRTPFGALTFLLSDLEPDSASHPVLILRGLTELIRRRAAGRTVILAVDNAEELDEFSAMVLSQMVLNRAASMLAAFRDFSAAPAEFMGLWREGALTRLDIGPLTTAECGQLAEAELQGPVSRTAIEELEHVSGGNPHQLVAAVADFRDSGRIRREEGVWILDADRRPSFSRLAAAMLPSVSGLSPGQRGLLEVLALCGTLPLDKVLERTDNAEVDALQESGLLILSPGRVPVLSLVSPAMGTVLRSQLDTGQRRELLAWLGPDEETSSPWLSADWLLSVGGQVSPELAAAAAREANKNRNPQAAAAILEAVPESLDSPPGLLERVRAHLERGSVALAAAAMDSHRTATYAYPDSPSGCGLLILENRIQCSASAPGSRADIAPAGAGNGHTDILDKAERVLEALSQDTSGQGPWLAEEIILARAECRSRHGEYAATLGELSAVPARAEEAGRRFRVLAGSWLCEAMGLTGRVDEALELAETLKHLMADAPRGMFDDGPGSAARARIVHTLVVTGNLRTASEHLDAVPDGTSHGGLEGTSREVHEGLLHAYAGRPAAATASLVPALSQLTVADPGGLKPAAASAAAYAAALLGQVARAEALLTVAAAGAAEGGRTPSWLMHQVSSYFSLLAEAALGSDRAVSGLMVLADEAHRRGAQALTLPPLLAAVRLGSTNTTGRLLDATCTVQGTYAALCATYANGRGGLDAQLLLEAAETAREQGHELLAHDASEQALEVASGAGDRATVRSIHRNRRMNAHGTDTDTEQEDCLKGLTAREKAIARQAAAGTSNKMIAQDLSISVRTVEGHLYQIYSKLHVGSRRELAKLVAAGQPADVGGTL